MTIRGVPFCARFARGRRVAIERDFTRKEKSILGPREVDGTAKRWLSVRCVLTSAIN